MAEEADNNRQVNDPPAPAGKPAKPKPRKRPQTQKHASKEEALKHMSELIRGKASKEKDMAKTRTMAFEEGRIEHLASFIKKPPKSLVESGNLPDLRREYAQLKSLTLELASKILDIQNQIGKIEQNRGRVQSELDDQRKGETKLHEALAAQWQVESQANEQLENLKRQRREEEITVGEIDSADRELAGEYKRIQKELKEARDRLTKTKRNIQRIPDRIAKADAEIAENLRKIQDNEKKLATLDKDLTAAKTTLESAITAQRMVALEYDRVSAEKGKIEDAYRLYGEVDDIHARKEKLVKSIEEAKTEIASKEKTSDETEEEKKAVKGLLEREEETQRQIRKDQEGNSTKIRELESKFSVYAELDLATTAVTEANNRVSEEQRELEGVRQKQKDTSDSLAAAKKEIQDLIAKEGHLNKKLEEVLSEKQRLEEDLQEISSSPEEKLIIELPDVLRDAIKKETEKITASQNKITTLEKTEEELKAQAIKSRESVEDSLKVVKAKEKELLYIKNKLGSSGYDEGVRLLLKRQIDSAHMEKKDLEAKIKASDAERKQLKIRGVKAERQGEKTHEELEELKRSINDAKAGLIRLDDELKSNRERRIKSWAGSMSLLRLLYPIKAQMDKILDEKSKIKAELDEAIRIQKKLESDLDSSEKYIQKCRQSLSLTEEDYVGLQMQSRTLEKQNNDLRAEKESLGRQLKDGEEHQPLLDAEAASHNEKIGQIQHQMKEKKEARKLHEKNIRTLDANIGKARKNADAKTIEIKKTEELLSTLTPRIQAASAAYGGENPKILKLLNDKQDMEKQLGGYKRRQAIIESEMKIISGIYDNKG